MTLLIKGIHYQLNDLVTIFIKNKMKRVLKVIDSIANKVEISVIHEKNFLIESHIRLKWGSIVHLEEFDRNLYSAINKMTHRLMIAVAREKDKHLHLKKH